MRHIVIKVALLLSLYMVSLGYVLGEELGREVRALVVPGSEAIISSLYGGRVIGMSYREGESFSEGDKLVIFDCREREAELMQVRADLRGKRSRLEILERLEDMSSVSELELLDARISLEVSRSIEEAVRLKGEECRIEAPYSGIVEESYVHKYEIVREGQPLLKIFDNRNLEIKIIVSSLWLSEAEIGGRVGIEIEELGGDIVEGEIERIGGRVEPVSKTVEIYAKITSLYNVRLKAGMSGVVIFFGGKDSVKE